MTRFAPLTFLVLLVATGARADGNGNVGLTLSPVGVFLSRGPQGLVSTYTAGVAWRYWKDGARAAVGGHVGSSRVLTEATPVTVHVNLVRDSWIRPYLGLGTSLLVLHARELPRYLSSGPLQVGAELSGGVGVDVGQGLFVSAEARYQNFSRTDDPFSPHRQELASAYLGLGVHL